jgi:8-oxo-dGTP diphosphatase
LRAKETGNLCVPEPVSGASVLAGGQKEKNMRLTTLCYIEKDDSYLMLHRVKKKNDINQDKWIGVGGHFEEGESPEECLLREVWEETGLRLNSWRFRGIVTFQCDDYETEYMCLYTSSDFEGELIECDEGILEWVKKSAVDQLPIWEGDKVFFRLLREEAPFFSLKLCYKGDRLTECVLDGQNILGSI